MLSAEQLQAMLRHAEASYVPSIAFAKDATLTLIRMALRTEAAERENGQLVADLMGCRDGSLVRDLRAALQEAERERDELKHDIERHLNIVAECERDLDEARGALKELVRLTSDTRQFSLVAAEKHAWGNDLDAATLRARAALAQSQSTEEEQK